jgi:hypothetical protein
MPPEVNAVANRGSNPHVNRAPQQKRLSPLKAATISQLNSRAACGGGKEFSPAQQRTAIRGFSPIMPFLIDG